MVMYLKEVKIEDDMEFREDAEWIMLEEVPELEQDEVDVVVNPAEEEEGEKEEGEEEGEKEEWVPAFILPDFNRIRQEEEQRWIWEEDLEEICERIRTGYSILI